MGNKLAELAFFETQREDFAVMSVCKRVMNARCGEGVVVMRSGGLDDGIQRL